MKNIIFIFLLLCSVILPQTVIDFETNGLNSNQKIAQTFESNGFIFDSNGEFYTNYGRGFDVYGISLYYVWEDTITKKIAMFMEDTTGIFTLKSFQSYQVSETVADYTLTVEGWYDEKLKYNKSFTDINSWQILDLNFEDVNKITISMTAVNPYGLIDFNFDDFSIIYTRPDILFQL